MPTGAWGRGNACKNNEGFSCNWKKLQQKKILKSWNGLPFQMMTCQQVQTLKKRLDKQLSKGVNTTYLA